MIDSTAARLCIQFSTILAQSDKWTTETSDQSDVVCFQLMISNPSDYWLQTEKNSNNDLLSAYRCHPSCSPCRHSLERCCPRVERSASTTYGVHRATVLDATGTFFFYCLSTERFCRCENSWRAKQALFANW